MTSTATNRMSPVDPATAQAIWDALSGDAKKLLAAPFDADAMRDGSAPARELSAASVTGTFGIITGRGCSVRTFGRSA